MSSIIVGRSPPEDAHRTIIADPSVSRKHCKVTSLGSDRYEIEDLGSTGGTFLKGPDGWIDVCLTQAAGDDEVRLGRYHTTVRSLVATALRPKANAPHLEATPPARLRVQRDPETGEIVRRPR